MDRVHMEGLEVKRKQGVPVEGVTPPEVAKDLLRMGIPGPVADKLIRHAYVGAYDRRTRNAAWVAEKLSKDSLTKPPTDEVPDRQKSHFKEDFSIPKLFRSRPSDYVGTGYDRGHLVPAADVVMSQEAVNETFLMTNISPQVANFNRGLWASFERFARGLVNVMDDVYVITGPLYLPKLEDDGKYYIRYEVIGTGEKATAVPTHFYKGNPVELFVPNKPA
ncbi:nuclease [Dinochytrium kinnereticum]|nr:nuclease [Dinochytrium kinnereticum]